MRTIMLAGDTHGSMFQWRYLIEEALKYNVDTIVQLGDYGFWEHTREGKIFLDNVSYLLQKANILSVFIDGNHENHVLLREKYIEPWKDAHPDEPLVPIRKSIHHAPRGSTWEWEGVKFLAMGGAFSIDRAVRRVGTSFWFEEVITGEEADQASKAGKVDVLLSHDVPSGLDMAALFALLGQTYSFSPPSEANRRLLLEVVEATRPDFLAHGHYHVSYKERLKLNNGHEVYIRGLGCDGMKEESYTIIFLEDGKLKLH